MYSHISIKQNPYLEFLQPFTLFLFQNHCPCTSEDLAVSLLLQHRINDGRVYVEVVKACARHVQWEKALLVNETRSDIAWN